MVPAKVIWFHVKLHPYNEYAGPYLEGTMMLPLEVNFWKGGNSEARHHLKIVMTLFLMFVQNFLLYGSINISYGQKTSDWKSFLASYTRKIGVGIEYS